MRSLIYASTARQLFGREDLVKLLAQSRDANLEYGITGMLLYKAGNFMQCIEGADKAIGRLYQNICNDNRHHHVITLMDETIEAREFAAWQMAFVDAGTEPVPPLDAYSDFLSVHNAPEAFRDEKSLAKKLLLNFRGRAR